MYCILILASSLALAFASNSCVPDQTKMHWKSPCDGQKFANRITATDVTVLQNGQAADAQGGLDLGLPIEVISTIVNSYGETKKPVVDLAIFEYAKPLMGGACTWKSLPTFGLLNNIDACTMVDNCHLTGMPTSLKATVDVKKLAGPLLYLVGKNTYYGLTLTFKDNKSPLTCVYIQDVVYKVS